MNYVYFSNNRKMAGKTLKFYQLNCHKTEAANIHLNEGLLNSNEGFINIGLSQEPGHTQGKITLFDNSFNIFQGCNTNPRACIVISKNINTIMLNQFSDQDTVAIQIQDRSRTIIIASIYMPYDSIQPPPPELMRRLVSYCESRRWGLIIGTDANSHNSIWGSTDTNSRGEDLLEYILTTKLSICNRGNTPTFVTTAREEVIDMTLVSGNIEQDIEEWKVNTEHAHSDHRQIEFKLKLKKKQRSSPYRNIRRTDWEEYKIKVKEQLMHTQVEERPNIDNKAAAIRELMTQAIDVSCPLTWKNNNKNRTKWWTKELTELKRKAARLKLAYRRNNTEENKIDSKEAEKEYRRLMNKTRFEAWKRFCEEMEDKSAIAKLQSIMKKGKVNQIGTLRRADGTYTSTAQETLEELLHTLFPDDMEDTREEINLNIGNSLTEEQIIEMVNATTVRAAMSSFKPYKSPGEDGIHPILIQKAIKQIEPYLTTLYRESIRRGRPATSWLRIKAVFIPKPGKTDYNTAKSYRPISLSSFLLKGLERLILWYMQANTLRNNPLNKNIFSYTEGLSTETALHRVVHFIEKSIAIDNVVIIVFMDISGAFSNTSISSLIRDLAETGIEEELLYWTAHLLSNRVTTAQLGDCKAEKDTTMGTMEGGIKSPVIWNIKISKCADKFPERGPNKFTGYADDAGLKSAGICVQTVGDTIQSGIKIMEEWATENKLTFNADKTKAMLFTIRKNCKKPNLYMNGKKIEYVDSFKYLGVTIDNKLRWTNHIENQVKKAKATMMIGRKMIGRDWGISPKTAYWLYTTTVRPILAYGSVVWINSVERTRIFIMLQQVQRMACLMITGAMPSTPTAGMETLLGIPPIDCYLKREALAAGVRLINNKQWRTNPGETIGEKAHSKVIENWKNDMKELDHPQDKLIVKEKVIALYETRIETRENIRKEDTKPMPKNKMTTISCFTDGSKSEEGTGAGYSIMGATTTKQESIYLGDETTIFQAEVVAINEASMELIQRKITQKQINFHIDSQSAITTLGSYITPSKTTLECKLHLNELVKLGNKVTLIWVPGHEGHMGNEVADRLAKGGANRTVQGPAPWVPAAKCVQKRLLNDWCDVRCEDKWRNREDCRQSKLMMPRIKNKWSKIILKKSKIQIKVMVQLVTGHANLKRHRHLMKLEDSPECDW